MLEDVGVCERAQGRGVASKYRDGRKPVQSNLEAIRNFRLGVCRCRVGVDGEETRMRSTKYTMRCCVGCWGAQRQKGDLLGLAAAQRSGLAEASDLA